MMSRALDPLPWQIARALRVARSTRLAPELASASLRGVLPLILGRGLNLAMVHALHARMHPQRLALVDERRTLSYASADREINRVANGFRDVLGLRPGDAVALALENRAEYLLAWFAAMRLGVRVLHAGPHATSAELVHFARSSDGRVAVVVSDAGVEAARRACSALPRGRVALIACAPLRAAQDEHGYEALACSDDADLPPLARPRGESVVFTSGTTGEAKGAVRDFSVFGLRELARVLERLPFQCGDRHLVLGPLHHSAPQVFSLIHTALGGTLHLAGRFDAAAALRRLARERIHSTFVVPTMLRRMLELPAPVQAATKTPELRALVVGSSEFAQDLRLAAIERFGARRVFDFYGATELGWVTLIRGDEMLERTGSVGRALAGQELRILDERGRPVPRGETGLVAVRNAQTMLGYAHDPGATRAALRGGFCTVEDLGRLDRDGYLYLSGRARDLVKSGGVNVYPAEVERVLGDDPAVREVAVVGAPNREWGERLVAFVVPRSSAFDPAQARARARERLSPAKVPREWRIVDSLPRNANGKVLRAELRERCKPSASTATLASPARA